LSVQAISWVIENSKHKGNSFVVLLMIANHARSDGTGAWPSIKTLARESRVSDRTVQRTIKRLTRFTHHIHPELKVQEGKGPHGCNMYEIPGVKLSPTGCQTRQVGVSDTVTGVVSRMSPEPSFNRPIQQPSNTARKLAPEILHAHNQNQKQKRLEVEAEVRVGAGPEIIHPLCVVCGMTRVRHQTVMGVDHEFKL